MVWSLEYYRARFATLESSVTKAQSKRQLDDIYLKGRALVMTVFSPSFYRVNPARARRIQQYVLLRFNDLVDRINRRARRLGLNYRVRLPESLRVR